MISQPEPQPLSASALLQRTITFAGAHLGALVLVALAVTLPVEALAIGGAMALGGSERHVYAIGTTLALVGSYLAGLVIIVGAIDGVLGERAGRPVTVHAMFAAAGRWFMPALGLSLLAGLGIFAGLVLCIVPGIFLAVRWSVILPALITEESRVGAALERSSSLVRGRWWPVFGLVLVGYVIPGVVTGLLENVVVSVAQAATSPFSTELLLANGAAHLIGNCLAIPFTAAFIAMLYLDLRQVGPVPMPAPGTPAGAWGSTPPPPPQALSPSGPTSSSLAPRSIPAPAKTTSRAAPSPSPTPDASPNPKTSRRAS